MALLQLLLATQLWHAVCKCILVPQEDCNPGSNVTLMDWILIKNSIGIFDISEPSYGSNRLLLPWSTLTYYSSKRHSDITISPNINVVALKSSRKTE
jgi:hypothetical protein